MLAAIKTGEIMFQLAVIAQEELTDGKVALKVNDHDGQLDVELAVDWQEFQNEFYAHPQLANHYLRQVLVEGIEGNNVLFVRLNTKGMPCSSTRMMQKHMFVRQYLFADQVGLA